MFKVLGSEVAGMPTMGKVRLGSTEGAADERGLERRVCSHRQ